MIDREISADDRGAKRRRLDRGQAEAFREAGLKQARRPLPAGR